MSWTDDFSYLLSPVGEHVKVPGYSENELGQIISIHRQGSFPDLDKVKFAILGVGEARRNPGKASSEGPDSVRQHLYRLHFHRTIGKIADLGTIREGASPEDSDHALKTVVAQLLSRNVTVLILGGSQELTFGIYEAYEQMESTINVAVVDHRIDMGEFRDSLSPENFLSKIVIRDPAYLFNLSLLGYQTYFVEVETLELMEKLYFDTHRLGELSSDLRRAEPVIRNADILSIDMFAVRNDSAPGTGQPNGLTGEQICQIARYAGLSDKTTSIGFFNYNPDNDPQGQHAMLIAQMAWYVMDGFAGRLREFPLLKKHDFLEYKVQLQGRDDELLFYKSKRTDKWWMNVPYVTSANSVPRRYYLVPCSYADYETAGKGEIPDIWWKTYQKLG